MPQGAGEPAALLELVTQALEIASDVGVADGAGEDVHGLQHGDAAGLEDGEDAGEAGHGGLAEHRSEDRQAQEDAVADDFAGLGAAIRRDAEEQGREAAEGRQPKFCQQGIEAEADARGQGQGDVGLGEERDEVRQHEEDQDEEGRDEGHDHDDRVGQGALDVLLDLVLVLHDVDQPLQDLGERAGELAGVDHVAVEFGEDALVLGEGPGKGAAALDVRGDGDDGVLEPRAFGLGLEHVEGLQHRDAGVEHGPQLLGEQDHVLGLDPPLQEGQRRAQALPPGCAGGLGLGDAGGDEPARGQEVLSGLRAGGLDHAGGVAPAAGDGRVLVERHFRPPRASPRRLLPPAWSDPWPPWTGRRS